MPAVRGARGLLAAGVAALSAAGVAVAARDHTGSGGASGAQAGWHALPGPALARAEVGVARVGRQAYVVGGFASDRSSSAAVERLDLVTRRWRRVADLPAGVNHPAAAGDARHLYVLGGYRADGALSGETAAVYRYDPARDRSRAAERYEPRRGRWVRLPSMRRERGGNTAAAVGGRLVVLGGEEQQGTIGEVEVFDPRTRRWRFLAPMPRPRHGLGAVGYRGKVVALSGGGVPGFSFSRRAEELAVSG
jgi:hypothetical protein